MALTETTVEDKIEVVGDHKHVQVRTATVIARDGTEISRSFHRHSLSCSIKSDDTWGDTDISGQSTEVQAICNLGRKLLAEFPNLHFHEIIKE